MINTFAMHNTPPAPRNQRGLSLVELMISLTISMFLLLGITTLIVQQSKTRDELEKSSRQIENGRYATQLIHDDVEHAGFYGESFSVLAPGATPDPCSTDPAVMGLTTALALPVQGYNRAPSSTNTAAPVTCIADANYKPGTDVLVIRRAGTTLVTAATTNDILLQSNAASYIVAKPDSTFTSLPPPNPFTLKAKDSVTAANLRQYQVHIYFISPCSVPANGTTCNVAANGTGPDDNGRPIPTLKMLNITAASNPTTPIPLVEGIEQMQLDYGTDNTADGYPDTYTMAPADTTEWSNVMAVRVNLLARNTECSTGQNDSNKTYNLGLAGSISPPASICTNGDYKRHVFSQMVRAVNPSGRRAKE